MSITPLSPRILLTQIESLIKTNHLDALDETNRELAATENELQQIRDELKTKPSLEARKRHLRRIINVMNQLSESILPPITQNASKVGYKEIFQRYNKLRCFYFIEAVDYGRSYNEEVDARITEFFQAMASRGGKVTGMDIAVPLAYGGSVTIVTPPPLALLTTLSSLYSASKNTYKYFTQVDERTEFENLLNDVCLEDREKTDEKKVAKFTGVTKSRAYYWKRYERRSFELNGFNCTDLIMDYMANRENFTTLALRNYRYGSIIYSGRKTKDLLDEFGLAPEQIEKDLGDGVMIGTDCEHFKAVREACLKLDEKTRRAVGPTFQKLYPNLCQCLVWEQIASKKSDDTFGNLLKTIEKQVVGQQQAAKALATALASQTIETKKSPVYLFVGPSGVGKTEMAKAVASIMKGKLKTDKDRLLTLTMSQYAQEFDTTKLFGAATGYVGSTSKPHFAKALDLFVSSTKIVDGRTEVDVEEIVILFDEFEKANAIVKQTLLTLFDEGYCEMNYTEGPLGKNTTLRYNLKNCIFVGTSNLFKKEILGAFEKKVPVDELAQQFKTWNESSSDRNAYSGELLNRMTIIPFGPIPRGKVYRELLQKKLSKFRDELQKEFSFHSVSIENEADVLLALEKITYGNGTDIRSLDKMYLDKIRTTLRVNNIGRNDVVTILNKENSLLARVGNYIDFLGKVENQQDIVLFDRQGKLREGDPIDTGISDDVEKKEQKQDKIVEEPRQDDELLFNGIQWTPRPTRGYGSCSLHAILGEEVDGEYCYQRENSSEHQDVDIAAKEAFAARLAKALNNKQIHTLYINNLYLLLREFNRLKQEGESLNTEGRLIFESTAGQKVHNALKRRGLSTNFVESDVSDLLEDKDLFTAYVQALSQFNYYFSDLEIELSAHLFNKRVVICQYLEGAYRIFPQVYNGSATDFVLIFHSGDHYSRCMMK